MICVHINIWETLDFRNVRVDTNISCPVVLVAWLFLLEKGRNLQVISAPGIFIKSSYMKQDSYGKDLKTTFKKWAIGHIETRIYRDMKLP